MTAEIVVPSLGESITEAVIARWLKGVGESAAADEPLVELETDKVTVELRAPSAGVLAEQRAPQGSKVRVGEVVGRIDVGATGASVPPRPPAVPPTRATAPAIAGDREELVPLSPLRRRIAERLVLAQHATASLTTFNEIDMSAVMALRERNNESFVKRHGIKLGFMSLFTKAAVAALQQFPGLNAEWRDEALILKRHYDIGIAVGTGKGLVVPVVRDADRLSFVEIERAIATFSAKAKENKLTIDEITGGTFTITNGGVFGSMLSTPLLNFPQTGILGMHSIVRRPVAIGDHVEVRPVMYVALTYDHRVVDGREAVQFLVTIKELLENPERMLFSL